MPTGDTVIRGRWTGPNVSSAQQISDAMKIRREAIQLILKVRDGKATPAEAQETADTLWLMSHEARKLPIWYENHQTGNNKLLWKLLRQWVTEEGLEPSEEARTAGVPWSVFYNRYGETFTPKQARERYGGAPDGNIGLWHNRNPVTWYQNDPGGLDEVMVGPPKEHGEGKSGDRYSEQDGTWITQAEAFSKYGIRPAGTTMEEWEQNHSLTRLPEWKHPDERHGVTSNRECTTETGSNNSNGGNNGNNSNQQHTTELNYVPVDETTRTIRQATAEELIAAAYAGTVYRTADETISDAVLQGYFEAFLNGDVSEFSRITSVYNRQVIVVLPDGQAALMMLLEFTRAIHDDLWPRGVAHSYSLNDRLPKGPTRITLVLRAMAENRWDEVHRYSTTDDVFVRAPTQDGTDLITTSLGEWVAQKIAEHLNEEDETAEPRRLTIAADPPHPLGGEPSTITIDSHCDQVELYRNGLLLDTAPDGWRDYTETWHHPIRHQYQAREQCSDDGVEMLATIEAVWRTTEDIPEDGVVEISMNPPKAAPGETIRMEWYIVGPEVEYITCDRPADTGTGGGTQGTMEWTASEPGTVYCVIRTNRQREGPNGPYTYVQDEVATATWE